MSAIRCQGVLVTNYPERREMLTQLGFVWDMQSPHSGKRKRMEDLTPEGLADYAEKERR